MCCVQVKDRETDLPTIKLLYHHQYMITGKATGQWRAIIRDQLYDVSDAGASLYFAASPNR